MFLTVVGAAAGPGVAAAVEKRPARPVPLFRRIVVAALLAPLLPNFWLFTDGAGEAFPGVTVPAVVILIAQHVAAAAVVFRSVTRLLKQGVTRRHPGGRIRLRSTHCRV